MSVRISIIVPVYNAASHLRACLDSILAQRFTDYECICVDDGSNDVSGDILDDYEYNDSRFRVVHQENAGAWAARNAALKVAQGEWLTFVDADDVLNPNWLQTYVDLIVKTDADLIRLRSVYGKVLPDGFADMMFDGAYEVKSDADAFAWMWNTMAQNGFLWCCCIRRKLTMGILFPYINCKEDSLWLLEHAPRVNKVVQGEFAGYFYRATEGSLMKQNRKVSQSVSYLKALQSLWERQRPQIESTGCRKLVVENIRACADNDVIEWVMKSCPGDSGRPKDVLVAYKSLEKVGALDAPYSNRRRYFVGFWWWKKTGQSWAIRWPGMLFLYVRRVINCVHKA